MTKRLIDRTKMFMNHVQFVKQLTNIKKLKHYQTKHYRHKKRYKLANTYFLFNFRPDF